MTNYLIRLALVVGALLTSAVAVIHARPSDNHTWDELFPDTCTLSCFMMIYPGSTTDQDALNVLNASAWVNPASIQFSHLPPSASKFDDLARIEWKWDVGRPASLLVKAQSSDGIIVVRNHVVESIAFDSALPAAAIYHHLGSPRLLAVGPVDNGGPWLIQWVYQAASTRFNVQMQVRACPYLADVWLQPVHIFITASYGPPVADAESAPRLDLAAVLHARKQVVCGWS